MITLFAILSGFKFALLALLLLIDPTGCLMGIGAHAVNIALPKYCMGKIASLLCYF